MSLINKMLQDLDARGGGAPGQDNMPQMRPVAQFERAPRTAIAVGAALAVALAAGGGWLGWRYMHRAAPDAAVANRTEIAPSVPAKAAQPALQPAAAIPAPVVAAAAPQVEEAAPKVAAAAPQVAEAAPKVASYSVSADGQERGASPGHGRELSRARDSNDAVPSAKDEARKRHRAEQQAGAEQKAANKQAKPARAAAASPSTVKAGRESDSDGVTMTSQQQGENAYRRGLAALQEGRVQEAIASMEQAVFLYPRHESARQTLVGLLLENKRSDEAVRHLQLGLGLDAKQPQVAMLLARLQIEKGGPAVETLQRTLPYARGNADYLAFLAGALQRAQNHREAAEQYEAALRLQPQNGVWWMGLGISLQADKRNTEALEAFNRAKGSGNLSQDLQAFVERRLQLLAR
jgi:MSHA biogenesis protein MshN